MLSRWFLMESTEDQQLSQFDELVLKAIKIVDQDPTKNLSTLPRTLSRTSGELSSQKISKRPFNKCFGYSFGRLEFVG